MSLVCTVTLDKAKGITVQIDNADDGITQIVALDGKTLTLTVKDSSNTSTYVQKTDSIAITCNDFSVDAETVTLKSKKASSWTSQDTLSLNSTKDMTFDSKAKLTGDAASDLALSAKNNLSAEATNALSLQGMSAAMKATTQAAEVSGTTLKLSGKAQADMDGAMIKVAATGQLDLQATGMTNVKGAMTNVSGLVKLG
ncbi:MAG TPA: hypothetical protein VGH20_01790 [Myxococcales bacterium]